MLRLPSNEHRMFIHLFRSSLIYFNNSTEIVCSTNNQWIKEKKWINKWTNQSMNKTERESEQLLEKHTQWPSSWIPLPFSESHPLPVFNIYFSLFLTPSALNSSVSFSFAHLIWWTVVGRWWFEGHHFYLHPSCHRKLVLTQLQTDDHDPPSLFSPCWQ